MKRKPLESKYSIVFSSRLKQTASVFVIVFLVMFSLNFSTSFVKNKNISESLSIIPTAKATHFYHDFNSGNLTLAVSPATVDLITKNDDWINIPGVEGYCGSGLTNQAGINPQNVTGTEYSNNSLPGVSPCVNANKGNPSAYNGSGVTEFDTGDYLAFGFQGNVQNNPYMVFYLNTTGQSLVKMNYDVIDIDSGNNNSVTQLATQYRVGETGSFINLPGGFVADATDGNRTSGRLTKVSVTLPPDALNQPKVQVRVLTTFAAGTDGDATPNEWVGVNNFVISNSAAPTAASVWVTGRAVTAFGRPISRALVTMTDSMGNTRSAITNPFGYYRFDDVQVGGGYVFTIYSKRFVFTEPTQYRLINGEDDSVNFLAQY